MAQGHASASAAAAVTALVVLLIVANGVGQAEYAQYSYDRVSFHAYWTLSCVTFSSLLVCLPVAALAVLLGLDAHPQRAAAAADTAREDESRLKVPLLQASELGAGSPDAAAAAAAASRWQRVTAGLFPHSLRREALTALRLAPFVFFSSYLWYSSLDLLPVSVNLAVYNATSVVFVFALSRLFLQERATPLKLIAIAVTIAGVVLAGLGQHSSGSERFSRGDTLKGLLLVGLSCAFWAAAEIIYSLAVQGAGLVRVLVLQALIGFWCLLLFAPLMPAVWAAGIESRPRLEPPVLLFLGVNCGFLISYYALYGLGLTIASPIYLTTTSLLSIPASVAADRLIHHAVPSALAAGGIALIAAGVALMTLQHFAAARAGATAAAADESGASPPPPPPPPPAAAAAAFPGHLADAELE